MKRDLIVYLEDIATSINNIEKYLRDLTKEEFQRNIEKQDSVHRRLEIIGEAVRQIPDDFREKYPDIPWRKIAGLRDVLIHEYFGISSNRIWNIIANDLPNLKTNIKEIVKVEKIHESISS